MALDSSIPSNIHLNRTTYFGIGGFISKSMDLNETIIEVVMTKRPGLDSIISNPLILSISIGSAIGNLLMLAVILCTSKFRKPANLLIANLSLTCFLFVLSSNIRMLENEYDLWTYSTKVCRILAVLHRIPIPIIALTTMTISLDRGRVARNPIPGTHHLSPVAKIILIWGFSAVILIPLGFTRKYDDCILAPYKCSKVLMFNSPYIAILYGLLYLMLVHIIPALILMHQSVKTLNKMKFLKISGALEGTRMFQDNRLRLLRNSCIFSLIFLIFWLPYGIFQFPLDLPREILPEIMEAYTIFFFKFLRNITYMQIALNPVILFFLSYDLHKQCPQFSFPWSI